MNKGWLSFKPNRVCLTCGQAFYTSPSVIRKGKGNYCTRKCVSSTGADNSKWRGGRISDPYGRIMVYSPGHPGARLLGGKYIYEYRLIAEKIVGRPLREDEIVHHINGDCTDNRIENLQVMSQSEHIKVHLARGDMAR